MPQHIAVDVNDTDDPSGVPRLVRYQRLAIAEADIRALRGLRGKELVEAFVPPEGSAGYRTPEALVFLLLRAIEEQDKRASSGLHQLLVQRCQAFFRGKMRGLASDDERMEVQSLVFEKLARHIVEGGSACEYMQARFWDWLNCRMFTAIDTVKRRRRKEYLASELSRDDDETAQTALDKAATHELGAEDLLLLKEGLAVLPEDLRTLYTLRHMGGFRVGDDRKPNANPNDPSLADLYKVSATAIKKRLAKADKLLAAYRKDSA